MANGHQDFQIPVNITAQDLIQMIHRPKYGAAQVLSYSGIVTPVSWTTLGSLSGTGMIYGGYVYQTGGGASLGNLVRLTLDGTNVFTLDYADTQDFGLDYMHNAYLFLIKADVGNNRYTYGFSHGITFESSVLVQFYDTAAPGASVRMDLGYALI